MEKNFTDNKEKNHSSLIDSDADYGKERVKRKTLKLSLALKKNLQRRKKSVVVVS